MPERERITCKLKIKCLCRAMKYTATRSSPASRTRDHLLCPHKPHWTELPAHTQAAAVTWFRKKTLLPLCNEVNLSLCCLRVVRPSCSSTVCSRAPPTGGQGHSPAGSGARSQDCSEAQSVWSRLYPSM